jgi:anti-anti-sigma regulatory factor
MASERAMTRVELGEHQSIRNVGELHRRLVSLGSHPEEIAIDAGEITKIDTAAMQTLVAFVRERCRRGLGLRWTGRSERFDEVAGGLGLVEPLGLATDARE